MKKANIERQKKLANVFDALGHYRRIAIVEELQLAGKDGIAFGDLAARTDMPSAALRHHIGMMKRGGFLHMRKKGSFTVFMLDTKQLNLALSAFAK